MMTLDRRTGAYADSRFKNLPSLLLPGDLLVFNDTRVLRARLFGRLERRAGTAREIEVLFVNRLADSDSAWEALCKPGRRIRPGDRVIFQGGEAEGVFGEPRDYGLRRIDIRCAESFDEFMERAGHVPLPPYIDRTDTDADRSEYQTIFAETPGAIAAPTAGLHFTPAVLAALAERGVQTVTITLHVGLGTFLPVRDDNPSRHRLKPERFQISEAAAGVLNQAKKGGRRIIAVGTTATRTLEHALRRSDEFRPGSGDADLYILPGFQFRAIDGLLTNFHLPRSTLFMLVSAFAGRENILAAYRHAIEQGYRFYSYGDCMLIA